MLAPARGRDNARIAADLQITVDTVRKWRRRFAARGLDGLADLPRPGRPRRIGELDRAAVVALACQLPAATGVPLGRWTGPELAAELAVGGMASPMSASSVLRILAEHPVRPWQYQSWIYPVTRTSRPGRRSSWTCTRKFTASDRPDLMARISRHEQQHNPQDKPLPEAA